MFIKIDKILPTLLKKIGAHSIITTLKAQKELNRIIQEDYGNQYIGKLKVISINKKILTIQCVDNFWANEIFLKKEKFLNKINKPNINKIEVVRFIY